MLDIKLETSLPDTGTGNLIIMHAHPVNIHYFIVVIYKMPYSTRTFDRMMDDGDCAPQFYVLNYKCFCNWSQVYEASLPEIMHFVL